MTKAAARIVKEKELNRLDEVVQELDSRMNQPYVDGSSVHRLRFRLKEEVIVLSTGLYYRGRIRHYYRLAPSLYKDAEGNVVTTIEHRIPTYMIRFDRFGQDADEEIPENELTRRVGTDPVAVFGMLYSHFWNTHKRKWLNKSEYDMGPDVWFLDEEIVNRLSEVWQKEFGKPCTFAEYCLPDYSPEKYPAV